MRIFYKNLFPPKITFVRRRLNGKFLDLQEKQAYFSCKSPLLSRNQHRRFSQQFSLVLALSVNSPPLLEFG